MSKEFAESVQTILTVEDSEGDTASEASGSANNLAKMTLMKGEHSGNHKLRVVIKIGSSSLVSTFGSGEKKETFLSLNRITAVIETICKLRRAGHEVALVSSGAVGTGCHCLGLTEKPSKMSLSTRQALAAVGQVHLMGKYESLFAAFKQKCAQVLLTVDSFNSKTQFLNASNTFRELFSMGVVPIVNENDTVATQELRSDNDTLAAMVASMIGADSLFLLTDVNGLYTANPNKDPSAKLIERVDDLTKLDKLCKTNDGMSSWGTGGMATKISAARLGTSTGVETVVMSAANLEDIANYVEVASASDDRTGQVKIGTIFTRGRAPPKKHKRWIRQLRCLGTLKVDEGAAEALHRRYSLFAVGIINCEGVFSCMDAVKIVNSQGVEIGTGLSNYSSADLKRIKGKSSDQIYKMGLGNSDNAVISRRNLVVQTRRVNKLGIPNILQSSYGSSESD